MDVDPESEESAKSDSDCYTEGTPSLDGFNENEDISIHSSDNEGGLEDGISQDAGVVQGHKVQQEVVQPGVVQPGVVQLGLEQPEVVQPQPEVVQPEVVHSRVVQKTTVQRSTRLRRHIKLGEEIV